MTETVTVPREPTERIVRGIVGCTMGKVDAETARTLYTTILLNATVLPAKPVAICKDGREFVMELATIMGVVDVCGDEESVSVSELMPKMLDRAKEDRERWHTAKPVDVSSLREILAQEIEHHPSAAMWATEVESLRNGGEPLAIPMTSALAAMSRLSAPAAQDDTIAILREVYEAREALLDIPASKNVTRAKADIRLMYAWDKAKEFLLSRPTPAKPICDSYHSRIQNGACQNCGGAFQAHYPAKTKGEG